MKRHFAFLFVLMIMINSISAQVSAGNVLPLRLEPEEILSSQSVVGAEHKTRISYEIQRQGTINELESSSAIVKFTLENPEDREVSFEYKLLSGSLYTSEIKDDKTGSIVFETGVTELVLEVDLNAWEHNPTKYGLISDFDDYWTGERIFFIYCYNIENALFSGDKRSETIPVIVENSFDYVSAYENATNALFNLKDLENVEIISENPAKFRHTREEIVIDVDIEGDVRTMIDMGVFTHIQVPTGHIENTSGSAISVRNIIRNELGFEEVQDLFIEGEGETSFGGERALWEIGLGRHYEHNQMIRSLEFSLEYTPSSEAVYTYFDEQGQVKFSDQEAPTLSDIRYPSEVDVDFDLNLGDLLPIILTYNEPVYVNDIRIKINNTYYYPLEREGTISESATFLYEVDEEVYKNKGEINIDSVNGACDLSGKEQVESLSNAIMVNMKHDDYINNFFYCANPVVKIEQGTNIQAKGHISISLLEHMELSNWIYSSVSGDDKLVTSVVARVIGQDGSPVDVPLYAQIEGGVIIELTGEFTPPINLTSSDREYIAEIYLKELSELELAYGLIAEYTVGAIVFITSPEDVEIDYSNWPDTDRISANNEGNLSLGYNVKVDATWNQAEHFRWSSSDETVAAINSSSGEINLKGKEGRVEFTLTALNAGLAAEVEVTSRTLTVLPSGSSFITIPEWGKQIEILHGENVTIHYATNIPYNNVMYGGGEAETIFTFTLYEANYEGDSLIRGEVVYEGQETIIGDSSNHVFQVASIYLTKLTSKDRYGYILEVSSQENETGDIYFSEAHIRIKEKPVKAVLQRPDNIYLTDELGFIKVSFDIENKNDNTAYRLSVKKNKNEDPFFSTSSFADINKKHSIAIEAVDSGSLLDVYTVHLEAKNVSDEVWSFDSYMLYVYNHNALKITVDQRVAETVTIKPSQDYSKMDSNDILAMLYIRKMPIDELGIAIDNQYKLSNIADKITWNLGKQGTLILKYKGVEISEDSRDLFLPGEVLSLEAIDSGVSSVIATHYNTGMTTLVPVTVEENPINELYVFYTYPKTKCQVSYINGNHEEKTVETDAQGRLGVYEKTGIISDVVFQAIGKEAIYNTTVLSNAQLRRNQNTSNNFNLYPQNIIKLVKSSKYDLNLKLYQEDGSPFTKDIIIRGGVYINGKYLSATHINGKKGYEDQLVSGNKGVYKLVFNPEEFADRSGDLDNQVQIEYKVEIIAIDNSHYPIIIELTNDEIQEFLKSNQEIYVFKKIQNIKESRIQNNVIVTNQSLILDGKKYGFDKMIGISRDFEEAIVSMDLVLSDIEDTIYEIKFQDNSGLYWGSPVIVQPTNIYPFSKTGVFNISIDMQSAINSQLRYYGLVESGECVQLFPIIRQLDSFTEIKLSKPLILQNMYFPSMNDSHAWENSIDDIRYKVLSSINDAGKYSDISQDSGVKDILESLSGFTGSNSSIGLEVIPTDDPLVYRGIIRFSLGSYSRENPSGLFVSQDKSTEYAFLPGMSDAKAMGKGEYIKNSKKNMEDAKKGIGLSGGYKTYGGGAYMESQIYWNKNKQQWDMRLLKSDTYIGGGVHYSKIHNTSIAGFPVTAEFKSGVTTEVGLKTVYDTVEDSTAYITELRPVGYVYGFGGAGVDLKVTAIKIGPYGQINHDQKFLWYDFNDVSKNGQKLAVSGSTGIEYKLQFLFFSKKGKYELLSAQKAWTYKDFNEINDVFRTGQIIRMNDGYYRLQDVEVDEIDSDHLTFQDRNYLSNNSRSWGKTITTPRLRSLEAFPESGTRSILTNAYPYSNPVISEDAKIMAYVHDMDSSDLQDTAVNFSVRNSTSQVFSEGKEISPSDYPDSDVVIAGLGANTVVAWTRTFTELDGVEGEDASDEDIFNALESTEIMTAVYDKESQSFASHRLTDNKMSDISPVVAARGNKAITAWYSVVEGNKEHAMDFSSGYEAYYSIYDGELWHEANILYDDSIDHIQDIKLAMLTNGTAAAIYQVNKKDASSEIMVTLINDSGDITNNIRLTNDADTDKNPQITVVDLPGGEEGFIIGWNKDNTIRIVAMDGEGNLYNELEQEIGRLSDANTYSGFQFVKGAEKIEDLTIIWDEPNINTSLDTSDIYGDCLWGIKFIKNTDGTWGYSGKIKVLELEDKNTADFYEAVKLANTNDLQLILTVSDYGSATENTNLIMAEFAYQNEIYVDEPDYLYEDIIPGMNMPVAFNIQNLGIQAIHQITINIGDQTYTFDEVIKAGEVKELLVSITVPDPINNLDYTINAQFEDSLETICKSGNLKLDIVDVSIDKIIASKEEQRERGLNISLSNTSYAKLREGVHTVKLELYNTADFDTNSPIVWEIISDSSRLDLMNDGVLQVDMLLDEEKLKAFFNNDGEIPEGGALVFFNVVVMENGITIEDGEIGNDMNYLLIRSLADKYGMPVSIGTMLHRTEGQTEVKIEAFNNSMNGIINGNFIAVLKDEKGTVLEKQQSYKTNNGTSSLVQINGEEGLDTRLIFTQQGASVDVFFTEIEEKSSKLSMLKMDNIYMDFEKDVFQYDISVQDLDKTYVLVESDDPQSAISIKKDGRPIEICQFVALSNGLNRFVVTVVNGEDQQDYFINITNNTNNTSNATEDEVDTKERARSSESDSNSTMEVLINGVLHEISMLSDDEDILLTIPEIVGANAYTLELPLDLLSISGSGLMTIKTHLASISLPRNMFFESGKSQQKTVSIMIASEDKSLLSNEALEAIGQRPYTKFLMHINGEEVNLKEINKSIDISIPYSLSGDELFNTESILINVIDKEGNRSLIINGSYNVITGTMDFQTNHLSSFAIVYNKVDFIDVPNNQWYSKAVNFIASRGITNGTSRENFSPHNKLNRGQFITIIMRAYDIEPDMNLIDNFTDAGESYYTEYLSTAKALGIAQGVGNNKFEPEREISRQEMFVLIYNTLKTIDNLPQGSSEMTASDFTDHEQIDLWAEKAITFLIEKGMIVGNDGKLNPKSDTTRAEMAQLIFNLLSN